MSTVVKPSELLRRALRWISEKRRLDPAAKTALLIDEAGRQFNLSPQDQETLWRLLREEDATACRKESGG